MIIEIYKCCGCEPVRNSNYIQKSGNYVAKISCPVCGEQTTGVSRDYHNKAMRKAAAAWNYRCRIPQGK